MHSEECQIQTLSSKNGKINEKTSSNDVKSKTQETFQNSIMGKEWEIFPLLGKPWDKKFLFRENFGNLPFPRSVKWVFIGGIILLFFITNIGKTLGIISHVISKL